MTFPQADLVQKYTGTRFIPPALPAVHRRESGRGFAMPHRCIPHATPQNWKAMTSKIPVPSASWPSLSPAVALGGTSWAASAKSSVFQQFAAVGASVFPQKPGCPCGASPNLWHCETRPCRGQSCRRDCGVCGHSYTVPRVRDDPGHKAVLARAPARDQQCWQRSCSANTPGQSPHHRTGTSHPSHRDRETLAQAGITPTCCAPKPETREPARACTWL